MNNNKKWLFLVVVVIIFGAYILITLIVNEGFKTVITHSEVQVSEGEYVYFKFTVTSDETIKLNISNLTNNGFEVFIFDEDNFDSYKNLELSYGLILNIPGGYETEGEYEVVSGTYYLIIDNTDWGNVAPPTSLTDDIVIMEIEAYYN